MLEKVQSTLEIIRTEGIYKGGQAVFVYILSRIPNPILILLYPLYSLTHPETEVGIIYPNQGVYKISKIGGDCFYVPELTPPLYLLSDIESGQTFESVDVRLKKYTSDPIIPPLDDMTIIDVGAFIGAFSIGACKAADRVISIEPGPANFKCLSKNIEQFECSNISIFQRPVYSEKKEMKFNLSSDPTDNSLLMPDSNKIKTTTTVTTTIDILTDDLGIDEVDLLKMDAEGAEPEVLRGAKNTKIKYVSIDCSAERDGESSFSEVNSILKQTGYQTKYVCEDGSEVIYGILK
jgi:FkbM family methyltransferase